MPREDGIVLKRGGPPTLRGILKGKLDSNEIEKEIKELRKQWRQEPNTIREMS